MTQMHPTLAGAPDWTPKLDQKLQPLGEPGARFSLEEVGRRATAGRLDPKVRQWAIQKLSEANARGENIEGPIPRATILLREHRKQFIWVPDPVHAEYMVGAHLLANGTYAGGDCDDKTIHLLASFLAAIESVGVRAAVVGHGYDARGTIQHVLAAIFHEKKWYYADPSVNDAPLGSWAKQPTRERVYLVPQNKLFCDAEVCLTGPGAKAPTIDTRPGDFVGVDGIPLTYAMEELAMDERATEMGVGDPVPAPAGAEALLVESDAAWNAYFAGVRDDLNATWARAYGSYQRMSQIAASKGISSEQLVLLGWRPDVEQLAIDVKALVGIATEALSETVEGKRRVMATHTPVTTGGGDDTDIGIELLPTDYVKIDWPDGTLMPALYNAKTGQPACPTGSVWDPHLDQCVQAGLALNPWTAGAPIEFVATLSVIEQIKPFVEHVETISGAVMRNILASSMQTGLTLGANAADRATLVTGVKKATTPLERAADTQEKGTFISPTTRKYLTWGLWSVAGVGGSYLLYRWYQKHKKTKQNPVDLPPESIAKEPHEPGSCHACKHPKAMEEAFAEEVRRGITPDIGTLHCPKCFVLLVIEETAEHPTGFEGEEELSPSEGPSDEELDEIEEEEGEEEDEEETEDEGSD